MRRAELAAGVALLFMLGVGALLLGVRQRPPDTTDTRRSTFVTAPLGASALAAALARLHVDVRRLRRRLDSLDVVAPADSNTIFAVMSPSLALSAVDAGYLAEHIRQGGDLLLAGTASAAAFRCFGLEDHWLDDSVRATPPGRRAGARSPWVATVFVPVSDSVRAAERAARRPPRCGLTVTRLDTLLAAPSGAPVVLRARTARGSALLISDGRLLANRWLRDTDAGEFALGLIAGGYRRVVFDEYHHGFGPSGSLTGAALAWSRRSPWGWAAWQLIVVGLIALAAGAVRFAPARRVVERRRRSPLEHVRALATALSAARGHDVAISTQVRGLRRRLARGRAPSRAPPGPWLETLSENVRTPRAAAAVATLRSLTHGPQPADAVLRAADAVEDVWEELKP